MKSGKAVIGFAAVMLLVFAATSANAQFTVVCKTKKNTSVSLTGNDGSKCFASADGTSAKSAKAAATGSGSSAEADELTGSHSKATATDGSFAESESDTQGQSITNASGASSANAVSDHHGVAQSTASGSTSEADTSAFGRCDAKATATGTGSLAIAECGTHGTFAHATATNGGDAEGSDTAPPTCKPGAGTAKVRSSHGNCG
jgi:hypothetical protein